LGRGRGRAGLALPSFPSTATPSSGGNAFPSRLYFFLGAAFPLAGRAGLLQRGEFAKQAVLLPSRLALKKTPAQEKKRPPKQKNSEKTRKGHCFLDRRGFEKAGRRIAAGAVGVRAIRVIDTLQAWTPKGLGARAGSSGACSGAKKTMGGFWKKIPRADQSRPKRPAGAGPQPTPPPARPLGKGRGSSGLPVGRRGRAAKIFLLPRLETIWKAQRQGKPSQARGTTFRNFPENPPFFIFLRRASQPRGFARTKRQEPISVRPGRSRKRTRTIEAEVIFCLIVGAQTAPKPKLTMGAERGHPVSRAYSCSKKTKGGSVRNFPAQTKGHGGTLFLARKHTSTSFFRQPGRADFGFSLDGDGDELSPMGRAKGLKNRGSRFLAQWHCYASRGGTIPGQKT